MEMTQKKKRGGGGKQTAKKGRVHITSRQGDEFFLKIEQPPCPTLQYRERCTGRSFFLFSLSSSSYIICGEGKAWTYYSLQKDEEVEKHDYTNHRRGR